MTKNSNQGGSCLKMCFAAEFSHDGISVRIPKANFLVFFFVCVQLQVRPTWQEIVPLCWVSVETLPGADSRGEIKLWVWVSTYLCGHSFSFSHHLLCSWECTFQLHARGYNPPPPGEMTRIWPKGRSNLSLNHHPRTEEIVNQPTLWQGNFGMFALFGRPDWLLVHSDSTLQVGTGHCVSPL